MLPPQHYWEKENEILKKHLLENKRSGWRILAWGHAMI